MPDFDFAVIGRGMTGAAAARHLSSRVGKVALIGPEEPGDKKTHHGVFASHYDEGRITRTIDPNRNWARLATHAIARYGEISRQSGIEFYTPAGCLIAGQNFGNGAAYVGGSIRIADEFGLNTETLDAAGLARKFPYFSFGDNVYGLFESSDAGYIRARRLVAAQARCAELNGAALIGEEVRAVRSMRGHGEIETRSGRIITAANVLVAAGGFTVLPGLLPDPIDLTVQGRTVTLFEVDEAEAERLKTMPAMIYEAEDPEEGIYLLPPIAYPDGRHYLKIGGGLLVKELKNETEFGVWFRGDGDAGTRDFLVRQAHRFVPDVKIRSIQTMPCCNSYTPTGYPAIGWTSSPNIAVMAGGCGAAAKSSDEIGRLGAQLLLDGSIADQGYDADFTPRFK